ncbi:TetR family transcriptional regulator [Mycobacterium mantenii]|nr:TetR/AcrR family transcriptional regulator [Mycobacterium mantenii]OBH40184.1 TetR family transcriptional regulator [Mycobacterium mantenii]OBH59440.1 TetR family transcriptional regulator [Mycobacterium mantenii]
MTTTTNQLGRPVGASGEQTRQRIIVAAMRCVAEKGYSRATIREIARTAGVTSASLYNYFPNKTELINAAIAARTEIALPRLRRAAEQPGDAVDRIEAVLDESGRLMREYPDLAAFEWAIRAQGTVDHSAGEGGDVELHALREIIEGVIHDAHRTRRPGDRAQARSTVEVIYALLYGLTELGATASPRAYQRALSAAKPLIRGAVFAAGGGTSARRSAGVAKRPPRR